MGQERLDEELANQEALLKKHWGIVLTHIRRDLANVWTDEVRKEFKEIKKDTGKAALILRKITVYYQKLVKHDKTNRLRSAGNYDTERDKKTIEDIRLLLHHLNKIESKPEWVRAINNDINRIIGGIEQTINRVKTKSLIQNPKYEKLRDTALRRLYRSRFEYLAREFDSKKHRDLIIFLIRHWEDCEELGANKWPDNNWKINCRFFIALKPFINEEKWPKIVLLIKEISKYDKKKYGEEDRFHDGADIFFERIYPVINHSITANNFREVFRKSFELLRKNNYFAYAFSSLSHIITENNILQIFEDISNIEKAIGGDHYFFYYSMPALSHMITGQNWPMIKEGTITMAKSGKRPTNLFYKGIPAISHFMNERNWPDLVRLVETIGDSIEYVSRAFPKLKFVNESNWHDVVEGIIKFYQVRGENETKALFSCLDKFEDTIPEQFWWAILDIRSNYYKTFIEFYFILPSATILSDYANLDYIKSATSKIEENPYTRKYPKTIREYTLPALGSIINAETCERIVNDLILIAKESGENAEYIFREGIPNLVKEQKDLTYETWSIYVGILCQISHLAGNGTYLFCRYGIPPIRNFLMHDTLEFIIKKFLEIISLSGDKKTETAEKYEKLKPLFDLFGLSLFDKLLIPTAKAQTIATGKIFNSYLRIYKNNGAIISDSDLELLVFISEKKRMRANDILLNFILQGIEKEGMPKPISQDAQCIKEFLIRSPVIMIEIYKEFKQVYTSNLPQKESIYNNLFKDVLQIKKDIIAGELSKEYDKNLVIAILYSVFTPEATIDRSQYELLLGRRQDRQNDIPAVLNKLSSLKVRISKGGFMLKGELDTSPWSMLAEVVFEVNNNKVEVIPEKLGIELLKEYTEGTLQGKRKDFLRLIYAFDMNNGNTLPNFSSNYEVLSKHMEFVGDRMQNDIIHQLLSKAQQSYPEEFSRMKEDKSAAYSGLAKTLFQLWNSNIGDKKQRIIAILQKNGFNVDFINWRQDISSQEIAAWLSELSSNVIQKSFIQRIFNALYGEEYARMKNEIGKFEFRREGKSLFGNPFQFVLSKKRLHCVAMFNFGVCVAPDDKLWNSEDFWQMIIFDEENKACGGVIYRTVIEDEKKYLIASIQPSSTVLSSFSPTKIYDKIIQFSRIIAKKLGYSNLLIPATSAIHSNRGSIQQEISARNYPRIKLSKTYEFSYSPYHYTYNEFFIAG